MPLSFIAGNLLEASVEAQVNAVNLAGVMGAGLALAFKTRHPENFLAYVDACRQRCIDIGKALVFEQLRRSPRFIINVATKRHWRDRTKLGWVEDGLADLRRILIARNIRSVAVPLLGAGLGGLDPTLVRLRTVAVLGDLDTVDVRIYERYERADGRLSQPASGRLELMATPIVAR